MIRYIVESMSHEFIAYNEIDPDIFVSNSDPLRALAELILVEAKMSGQI